MKAVIYYGERKLLSGIFVSEKMRKMSKTTNALNVHRLPAPFKTAKRVFAAVPKNKLQTISQIAESVEISSATCQRILIEGHNIHIVCQRIVLHMQSDQNSTRIAIAGDLISPVVKDSCLLDRIVTGNEKGCFLCDA
ncbi:hypothetical protein TNCV_5091391 [Trichonephila clavipes]|nr:hypothetical protein TNCV_5091391 [Trichonephila clavipes]